jgi:hypothetical protein
VIRRGALFTALAATFGGGCAQQEAPPGGPEDRRPPVVIGTIPEAFATVTELDQEIRFDFDERISERIPGGTLDDAVTVSPRRGEFRVRHGRTSLTVELLGGLEPDQVYRVTLQPVVSDLFSNRMTDAFDLVFSTGAEPIPTTVAGEVWGRVDGTPLREAYVQAVGEDSLVHQARTGEDGIFALRYLPEGRFTLTAFEDVNRNRMLDSMEVQGTTSIEVAAGDTLLVDVAVLAPDSTAARLMGIDALDSIVVTLEFDDFLEPDEPADAVLLTLRAPEGSAPPVARIFHEHEYAEWLQVVTDSLARLDSLDAAAEAERREQASEAAAPDAAADADSVASLDTLALVVEGDTAAAASPPEPRDTVSVAPPEGPRVGAPTGPVAGPQAVADVPRRKTPPTLEAMSGASPGRTRDGRRLLPGRRLVLLLSTPLTFDVAYEVEASGVVNVNGLPGGGGVDTLLVPSPPADTLSIDTLSVDTATLVDTAAVVDTGTARPPERAPRRPKARRRS